jgi:hypothetical protein
MSEEASSLSNSSFPLACILNSMDNQNPISIPLTVNVLAFILASIFPKELAISFIFPGFETPTIFITIGKGKNPFIVEFTLLKETCICGSVLQTQNSFAFIEIIRKCS